MLENLTEVLHRSKATGEQQMQVIDSSLVGLPQHSIKAIPQCVGRLRPQSLLNCPHVKRRDYA